MKIFKYCSGEVLDIGCLQHSIEKTYSNRWIHGQLAKYFTVTGIDINEDVLELRKRGYNVYQANAEGFDLGKKFDTVFAGELIEHLSNPGKFLDCAREHLKPDGKLILTTLNPFCIFHILRLSKTDRINPEHCVWFDETTLTQLVEKHGFKLVSLEYVEPPKKGLTWFVYSIGLKKLGGTSLLAVFRKRRGGERHEWSR